MGLALGAAMESGTFLFLTDGRVFVRRDDGEITEASPSQRRAAAFALAYAGATARDPDLGFELVQPGDS